MRFSNKSNGEMAMDRPKLNLVDVGSVRERELLDRVRDTEFDRIIRGEMDLLGSPSLKVLGRDGATLAQDAIRSVLLRQGGIVKV